MSDFSLTLMLLIKTSKIINDMAKVQIKSEKLTPFGGIFSIMEQFDSMLSPVIDSTLGQRCCSIIGYQYSEIVRSLMSVYFCGGSCVEDVTSHLMRHLSYHPVLRTCSSDTILRAIKELTQDNISYTSDQGKTYDFNTADKLNTLLVNALISTGELKDEEGYDVDFDHQFLETEKYDAKPTYKKFLGYRPGVYVIGDKIVYIENSDGNTNVRFYQADTHKRFFALLKSKNIRVNRFRADCGSCSKEIVGEIEKHCKHFYIRANRCSSLYDDIFALRGWKTEEINGIQFELNSILVEKWEGRCYRNGIQFELNSILVEKWEGRCYRCHIRRSRLADAFYRNAGTDISGWNFRDTLSNDMSGSNLPFSGRVIWIQGERTFSSAGMLITMAADNGIGTVVGTQGSYTPNHYGDVIPWTLPNTRAQGTVSHKVWLRPDAEKDNSIRLFQEFPVSLDDITEGIDPCWDWAVNQ